MPIFEFHCNECQKDSEILVRSAVWTGTQCPHCGSLQLDKKFSVFASTVGGSISSDAPFCPNSPTGRCSCAGGGSHSH